MIRKIEDKLHDLRRVAQNREVWRALGKRAVVTNGCFDLLHVGHVSYLEAARELGDVLIVGVNSDASVRALKGPTRPIFPQSDRACMLAALESVDAVVIFDDMRATRFLEAIKPDIYCKAGGYTLRTLDPGERAVLEKVGSEIRFLPLVEGVSTTAILHRLATSNSSSSPQSEKSQANTSGSS